VRWAVSLPRSPRGRALLLPLITLLIVGLLLPTAAFAKTTVTVFKGSNVLLHKGVNSLPAVTVVGHGLLKVTAAMAFDRRAGVLSAGAHGVAGATTTLPACAVGTCNDSYRGASVPRLTVGHYAERLELALTQPPGATGKAFGFAVELAVEIGAVWFSITGYFSSGTTTALAGQTVDVNLLVDLATTVLPTVKVVDSTLSACATTTGCP